MKLPYDQDHDGPFKYNIELLPSYELNIETCQPEAKQPLEG